MDEGLHKLLGLLITILDFNYQLVVAMYEQLASMITVMADQIERFEYFLMPYLKLIYLLPDVAWSCLKLLFSYHTYYNLIGNQLNTNLHINMKLLVSVLVVLFMFVLVFAAYYYRKICLLRLRINQLEKNPSLNMCVICRLDNSNVLLMPCAHLCLCLRCFYLMKKNSQGITEKNCPICRGQIANEIRIYY